MSAPTALRDAALGYAAAGWPVFPCWTPGKTPITSHGFKDATTDPAVIATWWTRWPTANIAVATGSPGPDVIDVDVKDGRAGLELFERARRAGLMRGAQAIIRTPSGGLHVWFEGTAQPGGAVGGAAKPLELKARGGYVLLPPSFVIEDRYGYTGHYELIERRDGAAGHIDFPAVKRLIDPPPVTKPIRRGMATGIGSLARWLSVQREGNRNRALFWAACKAIETGCTDLAELLNAGRTIGLDEDEVERTLESARTHCGVAR